MNLTKILVPTDGAPASLKAAETAVHLAGLHPGCQIVLVNVAPLNILDMVTFRIPMSGEDLLPTQLQERLAKNAQDILDATAAHIGSPANVEKRSVLGHPADAVCEMASELSADMIIIGNRGHGKIHRLFLGSVSDAIVHNAPCQVLVVKT
jgi:nucleotide-binding universal stress UspA family protein